MRNDHTIYTRAIMELSHDDEKRMAWYRFCMNQDCVDRSWAVWVDFVGPGEDDADRPPDGSISIYDPAVCAFLEKLYDMLAHPRTFGHQEIGKWEAA